MQSLAKDVLESKNLRWLIDAAANAMIIANSKGRILLANPAAELLFGYTIEEFATLSVEDLIPRRLRAQHSQQRADYAVHPRSRAMGTDLEIFALRKDGSEFDADVSLSPIENGLVLATIYDISIRQQALAAAWEFSESILATIQESLVVLDTDYRLVSANRSFYQMFHLTPEETRGQLFFELHSRQWDLPELRQLFSDIHGKVCPVDAFELQHEFPDLGNRTLSLYARGFLGRGDRRELILLSIEDITERKSLEVEQMRLIHELESANEELKNFAYVVSHDLKAPLRSIGSLANWIVADQGARLDAQGQEHMRLLLQRVRRLDGFIDGVLRYSRIGRTHETVVAVDLQQLVQEVIDLLAPPAHISITGTENLPTIRTERTRIQQVFQNLIANAIRFMDKPQGSIHVDCKPEGDMWRFSVACNGAGIEGRHFERIFQLFQTLNPRDRIESTGVGLTIVKKIVEMYGGRVWLESKVGQGSTFYFTLPKTIPDYIS
ncbi:MAG: sensor histidine kinase [Methylosarcina sp.]